MEAEFGHILNDDVDGSAHLIPQAELDRVKASFVLPAESIDRLREVAGRLLRQSQDYQSMLQEFGGVPPH